MQVSEISFCGHIGFNIKSDDAKKFILNKLENIYGIKIVSRHYDRFEEHSMKIINNNLHLICTRTNGNPYFLYLVKINFTNYCIFVDKKIQQGYYYPRMIIVHIFFDDSLFDKDIVFDGEMIKTDSKWIYMINDILVYNNKYLHDMNLVKRLNLCYELLKNNYHYTDTDIFNIMVKKYFKYDEIDYMLNEFIPTRKYTCRGIYFKPLYLKFKNILVNFDDSLICKVDRVKFKNVKNFLLLNDDVSKKPIDNITKVIEKSSSLDNKVVTTIDTKFFAKKTSNPDVYELYNSNGEYKSIAHIPNINISKKMRDLFQNVNLVTKIEVLCKYNEKFNKWSPYL
jgi:hypothetical protein